MKLGVIRNVHKNKHKLALTKDCLMTNAVESRDRVEGNVST